MEEIRTMDQMQQNSKLSLAMAYVPFQDFTDLYDMETGFDRGTIFMGLDKPFIGEEAVPR